MRTRSIRTLSVLALILTAAAPASADESDEDTPTIVVTGTGRVSAAPDVATIQIGVVTQNQTARAALAANNEAMSALVNALKQGGVAAKDIQTSNIDVSPQYSQPRPPRPNEEPVEFVPRIVGYQVTNTVSVTARNLAKLGELLDTVVQSGANQIQGISFRIDEPEKLLDGARKEAMADAKRKAEQLAGEAGVVLGPPLRISEQSGVFPPPPMGGARMMMMKEASVPISAGEQELTVNVSVTYRIQPPK